MKMKKLYIVIFVSFLSASTYAYKVEVHAIMTDTAARRSVLSDPNTWRQYGFNDVQTYLPITPYEPESGASPGAKGIWDDLQNIDLYGDRRVVGRVDYAKIMAFGADIEDTKIEYAVEGRTETFFASRALNHFYNPQNNTKLNLSFLLDNYTSPDWMLEDSFSITKQHFSYKDAQAYFYQVFAGSDQTTRRKAMAQTLQTLGHVVHHIQDMAQPQHTRLDSHCDHGFCTEFLDEYYTHDHDDTSIYEVYTQNIIRCDEDSFGYGLAGAYRTPDSSPIEIQCNAKNLVDWDRDWVAKTIQLNGYPVVQAKNLVNRTPTPRDFWTNENGTGIADFSSRNFVSTDTAFKLQTCFFGLACDPEDLLPRLRAHSNELPLPDGKSGAFYSIEKKQLNDLVSLPSHIPDDYGRGTMSFISSTFTDQYTEQVVTNERLVSYSMFNERFTKKSDADGELFSAPIFTTNYFNMDEHARLLIPRAVAYSAGMINFFFRYDLDYSVIRFDKNPEPSSPAVRAYIRITNNSEYDLSTGAHDILVQRDDSLYRKVFSGGPVYIPKGGSREFEIEFEEYDYSGRANIVFYNHNTNLGYTKLADAGLHLSLYLPEPEPEPEPDPEEPVIQCGAPINASGGSEGYSAVIDLGSESGSVLIKFEAYGIPDKLRIENASGYTKFSTPGMVYSYWEETVNFDAEYDRYFRVNVIANSDNNTEWDLFVGCPN